MKHRNCKTGGSGSDNYNVVRTLCEAVNDAAWHKAFDEYLKSSTHANCLLAIPFGRACRNEIRNIKAGRPSPRPPFCCCRGCFVSLLSAEVRITYPALDTELDGHDKTWDLVPIDDAPDESETDKLEDFLVSECHAEYVTAFAPALDDIGYRKTYLETFRELLRLAARLAKRLDEAEAAKNLLEALEMTLSDSPLEADTKHREGFQAYMSRETADEIYSTATRGWRQLWAAVEYSMLEPLPLKKATKRKA